MFKCTPCHVTAMIAAYESKQTEIHFGSFIAFIILFIKLLFAFHATLIIISRIYLFDFQSPYLHSEGCGRDWFHKLIENVIVDPQIQRKIREFGHQI